MGMIYILFGRPDDISRSMNPQQSYNYETWYYFQINEEFRFVDDFGLEIIGLERHLCTKAMEVK